MAATTMREVTVTSPPPALTLPSGSVIDENQNNSHSNLKAASELERTEETFNQQKDTGRSIHSEMTPNGSRSISPTSTSDERGKPLSVVLSCQQCDAEFSDRDALATHKIQRHQDAKDNYCSNQADEDCTTSNNISSDSPKLDDSKLESPESEDSVVKSLRSARRSPRWEDGKRKSESYHEFHTSTRRKHRSVNNNESADDDLQCSFCSAEFSNWSVLQAHIQSAHPDEEIEEKRETRKRIEFESPRHRLERRNLKNIPKVIGFQDINFIDFTSGKFPLVAKDVCEKSLHLSKDAFCFECQFCGRAFPCSSALDIHLESCESRRNREDKRVVKKNKRKSTPKFRPQTVTSESDESDNNIEVDLTDKRRNEFFNSLDLRNTSTSSKSSHKSSEDEGDQKCDLKSHRSELKPDLADIQSMISVTNIPGINVKRFSTPQPRVEEKSHSLNIQVNSSQSSPGSFSSLSMNSPNFSMMSLISPNYSNSDQTEEEAQDCFAAECRRMKLRGEFPCKLCSQVFPNLRALKGHNRVHISAANGTTNSPYRCNICTYNSFDKATLVRHMRSHNGDRPYECAMCNYAFTTKANCERHLRNRHSKMTRDDVKNSIIYHPSEDPVNDSEYQKTSEMNRKNIDKSRDIPKPEFTIPVNLKINLAALKEKAKSEDLFQSEHQELLKNMSNGSLEDQAKSEAGTMTEDIEDRRDDDDDIMAESHWNGEEALDLRVKKNRNDSIDSINTDEPEDLSRKAEIKEFNNNLEESPIKHEYPAGQNSVFGLKPADLNNYVKMYSAMYPFLNINQIHQIILNFPNLLQGLPFPQFLMPQAVFHNANYAKNYLTKDALGLQMSGGSIMDEAKQKSALAQKLLIQQEALANIMLKREQEETYKKPTTDYFDKPRANDYFTESDKKAFQEILVKREAEKTLTNIKTQPENNTDNRNTAVKMVIKNGVLMPKQKQRRYRTERPFSCEHCSARFTLRSNMERHIKQQHPQHWTQKSRYNVGSGRKPDSLKLQNLGGDYYKHYDSSIPTSLLSRSEVSSTASENNWDGMKMSPKSSKLGEKSDTEEEPREFSDEEESKDDLIIDEETEGDHMRLLANASEYARQKQQELGREERVETGKDSQPQDLASVSKMLDCAVTQTQAFQKFFQEGSRKEEDECRRDEGDRSEEEEGLVAGSTSSDENRSESETCSSKHAKKKSAYSLAPNRVSCPYCFRKFPWTSSLRRHVLTHTGQKPFKCTHCPLLFTTKSNCDRHLLRKHGREALIASSGHTDNPDGNGNNNGQSNSQNPNFTMRNVPERPFKCTYCPSSTFSSQSNLNKHMMSKHHSEKERSSSPDHTRVKNINPSAPPNVTISPTFPINIPKALSIIPQYQGEASKTKRFPINVPSIRVQEWAANCNGERDEERKFRKRRSSDETEASERKRQSPDLIKTSPGDSQSDAEHMRHDLPPIPPSELPFKCHLCEGSFGERSEALDHIRLQHPTEFQLLMSKGALETTSEEDRIPHDDHDDTESTRGRFPDYANRKVMCAFCMRRFWSAEDLRRHMRTHTGERPFSCDVCHRKFTLKHSMLRHRKKHSATDEILVGSDEEHHNNNLPVSISTIYKGDRDRDEPSRNTILHQTLTQRDENTKEDSRGLSRESTS